MFVEFFCAKGRSTRAIAVCGAVALIVYSCYKAWLSVQFTIFYRDFYDLMQTAGQETDDEDREIMLQRVFEQLLVFAQLAIPAAIVQPIARWIRSRYALSWRVALVHSYLERWERAGVSVEGASQRVQEDTQRFGEGIEAVTILLDSLLTMCIFAPRLLYMGQRIHPPWMSAVDAGSGIDDEEDKEDAAMLVASDAWLLAITVLHAAFGTVVAFCVARKLVDLEVNNQVVEAAFRKDLVLWETCVRSVSPAPRSTTLAPDECGWRPSDVATASVGGRFIPSLIDNYRLLYLHFAYFNAWVAGFEQATAIIPFVIATPQLFEAVHPITLGTIVEFSRVFDQVFTALTTPMHNWAHFNEFRSVIRRLYEFERIIPSSGATTPPVAIAEVTPVAVVQELGIL